MLPVASRPRHWPGGALTLAPAVPCLLKVALVGGQPLGGQLLQDVVQHQVDATLRQLAGALHTEGGSVGTPV